MPAFLLSFYFSSALRVVIQLVALMATLFLRLLYDACLFSFVCPSRQKKAKFLAYLIITASFFISSKLAITPAGPTILFSHHRYSTFHLSTGEMFF
jgi:hypothetical protein